MVALSLSKVLRATDRVETIANQAEGREGLAFRIERLVGRRAKWAQTREAEGLVFHAGSIFSNAETDWVETGHFWTMYGDGPVCAGVAATLHRVVGETNQGLESPR